MNHRPLILALISILLQLALQYVSALSSENATLMTITPLHNSGAASTPLSLSSGAALQLTISVDNSHLTTNSLFIVRQVGSSLQLVCSLTQQLPRAAEHVRLAWYIPTAANYSAERISKRRHGNHLQLVINNLQSYDSGNFTCEAQSDALATNILRSFQLIVRPSGCPLLYFRCHNGDCIPLMYKCDSVADCSDASDEELDTCGVHVRCSSSRNVFDGQVLTGDDTDRLFCDGRCLPRLYCCHHGNCSSGRFINEDKRCCRQLSDDYNRALMEDYNWDRSYLETAIYTIIGCAVAFIMIVAVMIVAFCRVHLRQSAHLSSYAQVRVAGGRHQPLSQHLLPQSQHLPPEGALLSAVQPHQLMVTYNINNGVQMVPCMNPPSYSEAVSGLAGGAGVFVSSNTAPSVSNMASNTAGGTLSADPPPPYMSCETLAAVPAAPSPSSIPAAAINTTTASVAGATAGVPPQTLLSAPSQYKASFPVSGVPAHILSRLTSSVPTCSVSSSSMIPPSFIPSSVSFSVAPYMTATIPAHAQSVISSDTSSPPVPGAPSYSLPVNCAAVSLLPGVSAVVSGAPAASPSLISTSSSTGSGCSPDALSSSVSEDRVAPDSSESH